MLLVCAHSKLHGINFIFECEQDCALMTNNHKGEGMFRNALKIANEFTCPIVISRKSVSGVCSTMIGTYVIVNDEGWIVTAGHILRMWSELTQQVKNTHALQSVLEIKLKQMHRLAIRNGRANFQLRHNSPKQMPIVALHGGRAMV